jgi:hypothetical protein
MRRITGPIFLIVLPAYVSAVELFLCALAKISFIVKQNIQSTSLISLLFRVFVTVYKPFRPRPWLIEHVLVLPKTA